MTSSRDVQDILGLPQLANGDKAKSKKKPKPTVKRPDNVSRELYQLLGERAPPPIAIQQTTQYKAKRKAGQASDSRWRTVPFRMTSRDDGLLLRHWRREMEAALPKEEQENQPPVAENMEIDEADKESDLPPAVLKSRRETMARLEKNAKERVESKDPKEPAEDSKWSKHIKPVEALQYDDVLYEQHLKSDIWSREETDYLVNLYADFYGKWPLIWDRYEPSSPPSAQSFPDTATTTNTNPQPQRSMEDLKTRFYAVSAACMENTTPQSHMTQTQFTLYNKLTRFNPVKESDRKAIKARLLIRSKAEKDEERMLLHELEKIYKRHAETEAEGRDLRARLDHSLTKDEEGALSYTSSAEINGLLQKMLQKEREGRALQARNAMQNRGMPGGGMGGGGGGPSAQHGQHGSGRDKRASLVAGPTPARHGISAVTEARFGVKSYERLPSGVTFKSDRVAKARVAKSAAKTERIASVLGELGVPEVLQLPSDDVCKGLESVVTKILDLVERRRVLEREENDVRVEREKRRLDEGGAVDEGAEAQAKAAEEKRKREDEEEAKEEEDAKADAAKKEAEQKTEGEDAEGDAEGEDAEGDEEDAEVDETAVADEDGEEEEEEEMDEDEEQAAADAEAEAAEDEDGDVDMDTTIAPDAEGDEEDEEEEEEEAEVEEEEEEDDEEQEEEDEEEAEPEEEEAEEEEQQAEGEAEAEEAEDEAKELMPAPPVSRAQSRKRSQSVLSTGSGASKGSRRGTKRRKA